MTGMMLAIEMHRRRIHCEQHHHEEIPSYRSLFEPSMITTTAATAAMDEAALKARQRLEEKLGYFRPSRLRRVQAKESRGNNKMSMRDNHNYDHHHLVSRILWRPWHVNSSKSKGQLCAICLEDFRAERQVMELSCSHMYHSECLLPWLTNHPNCPSCRTPVQI